LGYTTDASTFHANLYQSAWTRGAWYTCLEAPSSQDSNKKSFVISIQLTSDLYMFLVFVHKLEARVLHEHDPLILLNRHRKAQIHLCT
jgi:hypothetical protein